MNPNPFARLQGILVRGLALLCAAIFACLVVTVLWGVFTRQILDDQPAWTEELARFLLVWLAMLGGVLAYADDRHLGVDVLTTRFDPASRGIARVTSHAAVLAFAIAVLLIGGGELFLTRHASGQMMSAMGIRKSWFYAVLPLSGALITLLAIGKLAARPGTPTAKEESP